MPRAARNASPPPADLTARARALDEAHGPSKAAALAGANLGTWTRVVHGLPVMKGTVATLTAGLARLDAAKPAETPVEQLPLPLGR